MHAIEISGSEGKVEGVEMLHMFGLRTRGCEV